MSDLEALADEIEAAATRVADATLCQWGKPNDCGREGQKCLCEEAAKAALSALSRPEANEGAVAEIAAERRRQIAVEGWSAKHDDEHQCGEMACAAAEYTLMAGCNAAWPAESYQQAEPRHYWPWDTRWWKPKDPRRDLIRAAALIIAEIERLDRKDPGHD